MDHSDSHKETRTSGAALTKTEFTKKHTYYERRGAISFLFLVCFTVAPGVTSAENKRPVKLTDIAPNQRTPLAMLVSM